MKNINSLITKHGGLGSHNENSTTIFPYDLNLTPNKNDKIGLFAQYSGIRAARFLMIEKVEEEDSITFNEINYFVVKSNEIQHQGNRVYSDVIAYENDFIVDLSFTKQILQGDLDQCNVPGFEGSLPYHFAKGRVKSISPNEYLQYSFNQNDVITHVISVRYTENNFDKVEIDDLIKGGGGSYQIITIENIDNQNRLIQFNCIDRLSTNPFSRIAPPSTDQTFGGGQTFNLNPINEDSSETEPQESESRPAQSQTSGRKPKKPPKRKPKKDYEFPDIEK